jgi:phosphate transport system protein
MIDHTVKSYDKEFDTLERRVAEMGGIAKKRVVDAMDSLANSDSALAAEVVATDPRVDALQCEIEDLAVVIIARRQPVAPDLREVIGVIRVAGDLERVGDLAKNIAKRTAKSGAEMRVLRAIVGLKHMNEFAAELLMDVLNAFAQRDEERAREVWERDIDLDALDDALFRDLLRRCASWTKVTIFRCSRTPVRVKRCDRRPWTAPVTGRTFEHHGDVSELDRWPMD